MSQRLKITLPDDTLAQLRAAARASREPMARLASRLISAGLSGSGSGSQAPTNDPMDIVETDPGSDRRAPWLEPWENGREWRRDMWGSITALHERYPRALGHLKFGWWEHSAHVETLCALVVWRTWLDQTGNDPREELLFHAELEHYSRTLQQERGGVRDVWLPDAPPDE